MVCLRGGAEEDCCAVSEWLPTWLSPTRPERAVSRLRKWLILRLVSIVDTLHVEKEEDVIEEVARCEQALSPAPWRGTKNMVFLDPEGSGQVVGWRPAILAP